jgi:hypothetical protein
MHSDDRFRRIRHGRERSLRRFALAVTDTTLRLTTLQAGGDSGYVPVGYSDFIGLTTLNPDGYGTCQ